MIHRAWVWKQAPFILKKLRALEAPEIRKLVLKLLKKQVRYLPRKWRQANMKVISAIYAQARWDAVHGRQIDVSTSVGVSDTSGRSDS